MFPRAWVFLFWVCFLFLKPGSLICLMVKPKTITDSFCKNPQSRGPSPAVKSSLVSKPSRHRGGFLFSPVKPVLCHYLDEKYHINRSLMFLFAPSHQNTKSANTKLYLKSLKRQKSHFLFPLPLSALTWKLRPLPPTPRATVG